MRRRTGKVACGVAGPFDGDAPLGFVEQIFDIGAILAVDGDAAAARDVADDVVAGNRIAAFRAIDHQIVVAAHDDRAFVHAQHALDGCAELRCFSSAVLGERLPVSFGKHLPRGPFSVAEIGVEVVDMRAAVFGGDALPIFVGDFLQMLTPAWRASFSSSRRPTSVASSRSCRCDPLPNFAARARGVNERKPVARRLRGLSA